MYRLDVAWLGRDNKPIVIRTAKEIQHGVQWRRLYFAGKVAFAAILFLVAMFIYSVAAE